MQKPDQYLRNCPLEYVVKQADKLKTRIMFDDRPLQHEIPRKLCFCKTKETQNMMLCETCEEWYHFDCIGVTCEQAEAEDEWKCGYCQSEPSADGFREWKLNIPQGNRKRPKVAKPRNDNKTPKALGYDRNVVDMLKVGPTTWAEIVTLAEEGGRKIRADEEAYKKQAKKIVDAGGHHIVDQMGLGGVDRRSVTKELVDDLFCNGILERLEID